MINKLFLLTMLTLVGLSYQNCGLSSFEALNLQTEEIASNSDSNVEQINSDEGSINSSSVSGKTYYVALNGNDVNLGTLSKPFRTIKKGVSVLKPGDATYVRAGTYTERLDTNSFNFPSGMSWTSAVKVAVYPGEKVLLRGGFNFGKDPDRYIIIDGFTIEAGHGAAVSITQGSNHIRVQNCEIRNSEDGIQIFWGNNNGLSSDYNEILNNHIHHIGSRAGYDTGPYLPYGYGRSHCIYVTTSNNIFRGNHIHDCGEYGIHQWTALPKFTNNNIIDKNVVHDNGKNTTRYGHVCCGGITVSAGSGTVVSRNVVYNHFQSGISVGTSGKNIKVFHNTVVDYKGQAYAIHALGTGEIKNNMTYPRPNSISSGFVTSTNFTANPLFVNPVANNFRLTPSSPARNRGTTIGVPAVPDGKPDIGAYEL